MKNFTKLFRLFLLAAFLLPTTACIVAVKPHRPGAVKAKSCPPGHRWSDGRCHAKGKGNDPGKHKHKRHP